MALEHEIKLHVPTVAIQHVQTTLLRLFGQPDSSERLENHYFDTPDLRLADAKIALRLRHTPTGWLQTLKTAGVVNATGLHSREEWEFPIANPTFQFDLFAQANPTCFALLQHTQNQLQCLFQTNFTRTIWFIAIHQARFALALDIGQIVLPHCASSQPLAEIEIELLDGELADLKAYAQTFQQHFPELKTHAISKAQRGYQLYLEKK